MEIVDCCESLKSNPGFLHLFIGAYLINSLIIASHNPPKKEFYSSICSRLEQDLDIPYEIVTQISSLFEEIIFDNKELNSPFTHSISSDTKTLDRVFIDRTVNWNENELTNSIFEMYNQRFTSCLDNICLNTKAKYKGAMTK